jgi:hypothetical protein
LRTGLRFVRARTEDERRAVVYGVVSHIETVPFDASRRPSALWTSEDEMDARHPQIGKLLRTTFAARSIGWSESGPIIYSLPQQPPRLHSASCLRTNFQARSIGWSEGIRSFTSLAATARPRIAFVYQYVLG